MEKQSCLQSDFHGNHRTVSQQTRCFQQLLSCDDGHATTLLRSSPYSTLSATAEESSRFHQWFSILQRFSASLSFSQHSSAFSSTFAQFLLNFCSNYFVVQHPSITLSFNFALFAQNRSHFTETVHHSHHSTTTKPLLSHNCFAKLSNVIIYLRVMSSHSLALQSPSH